MGRGWDGGGSGWASKRRALPAIRPQTVVLCFQQVSTQYTGKIKTAIGSSLTHNQFWLVFSSGPTGPVMHQHDFTGLAKSCLWKQASATTYSYIVDASGHCMSESLIIWHNLDLSSCDILVSFINPVTFMYDTSCHLKMFNHHNKLFSFRKSAIGSF